MIFIRSRREKRTYALAIMTPSSAARLKQPISASAVARFSGPSFVADAFYVGITSRSSALMMPASERRRAMPLAVPIKALLAHRRTYRKAMTLR